MRIHHVQLAIGLATAMLVAGCQPAAAPHPSFCDGMDSQIGGCDADRPSFASTTCAGVGEEFGTQLDTRLRAIYVSPPEENGESRATRAGHVTGLTLSLANLHLRRLGIIAECGAAEFMAAAETQFSAELKNEAGTYLADGPPVAYAVWLDWVRGFATIIDMEEDAPVLPASSPAP